MAYLTTRRFFVSIYWPATIVVASCEAEMEHASLDTGISGKHYLHKNKMLLPSFLRFNQNKLLLVHLAMYDLSRTL